MCIVDGKKWVRGSMRFQTVYDGKTYHFPGEAQKKKFLANPVKYVPAFGGDCVVCYKKMGKRMPGNIRHAAYYGDRLFLFPGDAPKKEFLDNAPSFADVDLALGGKCAVCKTEMSQEVPGKAEFTAIYQGLRYQFPSAKQRDMFLKTPAKYAEETSPSLIRRI